MPTWYIDYIFLAYLSGSFFGAVFFVWKEVSCIENVYRYYKKTGNYFRNIFVELFRCFTRRGTFGSLEIRTKPVCFYSYVA